MPRLLIGAIGALMLLLVLLSTAPARLIVSFLPAGQVVLQGVSGTLWRGVSSRAMVAVQDSYLHLGRLSWSLSPLSLFTLAPRVALDSRWGEQRFDGQLVYHSASSLQLSDVDAVLPAGLVRHFIPLDLTGSFALLLPQLQIEDGLPRAGTGRIVWQNGGWISPRGKRPLGTYALDFEQDEGGRLEGEVVTLSGELEASGSVSLDGTEYAVDIVLRGRGLDDPQLQQALQLVAIPEGDQFRVKMQGSF